MSDNEVAIVIIAIVFGSILGIVVVSKLAGLIKAWINRNKNSYDEEKFERLAKAFIQHKKSTERRLKNLEAPEGKKNKNSSISGKPAKEGRLQNKVQINPKEEQTQPTSGGGNLNNMLRNEESSS
jgi:hypothetical protein